MKIVIIGGHHISALVLAKELRNRKHQVYWLGTRFPRWPEKTEGVEYRQVKAAGFPFYELRTGKFHANLKHWWRIPRGFFQAFFYLRKLKPDLIFSFGGYLAVPVVLNGWFLGIPSFTHEQTRIAGLANRLMKFFVKKVFLTWPESSFHFPQEKSILVGLPLRKEILFPAEEKMFKEKLPVIYVVGGKQGSHILNLTIKEILAELLKNYNVVHQCGEILEFQDYKLLKQMREKLPSILQRRYILHTFFDDQTMGNLLKQADLVIGRAGAHIVYELAFLGKPAIFIPLPFSFAKEQEENAKIFVQKGAGVLIKQEQLNGKALLGKIKEVFNYLETYKKQAQELKKLVEPQAAKKIANYLERFFYEKKK